MATASPQIAAVQRREVIAWAMYDFANSGYTTVVLTTVFSAYFTGVLAAGLGSGTATLLWTLAVSTANAVVLISGPVLGAMADYRAQKKPYLLVTTVGCVLATALLGLAGPGEVGLAMILVILATIMFASGENLIAAFLPELASSARMGRISGYGWSLGYFGGLLTLVLSLAYIQWAQRQGHQEAQFVPVVLWITALIFALAAVPTFLWLRERATPIPLPAGISYLRAGFGRVRLTLLEARRYQDFFHFLVTLVVYQSGVAAVVVLAAIYAREVLGFTSDALVVLIIVVNLSAAVGAFIFGHLQDRLGAKRTLALALAIWIVAIAIAFFAEQAADIWLAGNLIGVAMGASQAVGRALIGVLTPLRRSGEFFGLWGLANRFAAIAGPLSYGLINYLTAGDHRLALLSTLAFFVFGLLLLLGVNEARGKAAALNV